jgi:CO/xanthine dehydrogenase FAD-binding subunit
MLIALGAKSDLVSKKDGPRELALDDLYRNDGIELPHPPPDEVLTNVLLPPPRVDERLLEAPPRAASTSPSSRSPPR